jgi:hypothetical protein
MLNVRMIDELERIWKEAVVALLGEEQTTDLSLWVWI